MSDLPEISFTIPLKAVAGKGARAAKFRQDSEEFVPVWFPSRDNFNRRYALTVHFHYLAECNGDMDNRLLCVFDALKGKVIYDDSQIKELSCKMVEYSDTTSIVVHLKEIPKVQSPIPVIAVHKTLTAKTVKAKVEKNKRFVGSTAAKTAASYRLHADLERIREGRAKK